MAPSSDAKSQQPEREVHDMISKLTDRLVSLGQGTPEQHHDGDHGVRIITLAGENKGAAMKATSLDELVDTQGMICNDENLMSAYTNSNYQAVNNSIMLDGSCSAEDPGVHITIVDKFDDDDSSSDDSESDSESDSDSGKSGDEDKKGKGKKKKEEEKKKEEKKKKEGKKEEGKKKGKEKKGRSKKEHDQSEPESEKEEKHKRTE